MIYSSTAFYLGVYAIGRTLSNLAVQGSFRQPPWSQRASFMEGSVMRPCYDCTSNPKTSLGLLTSEKNDIYGREFRNSRVQNEEKFPFLKLRKIRVLEIQKNSRLRNEEKFAFSKCKKIRVIQNEEKFTFLK